MNFLFYMCFVMLPLSSVQADDAVYLCTLPKAGTHCIEKYFKLLSCQNIEIPHIRRSHLSEHYLGLPKDYFLRSDVKKIIMIRDFRDVFLSALNWIETKHHWMHASVVFRPRWNYLSNDDKLLELIDYTTNPANIIWSYKDRLLPQQIRKMIDRAVVLSQCENALVVKYEYLSGGYGVENQLAAMREINDFLGIRNISKKQYIFLSKNLFGNAIYKSPTFRKGNVNSWCLKMSPEILDKIWDLYELELLHFGYSKEVTEIK